MRASAAVDLDLALRGYEVDPHERELLAAHDPRLLAALGAALRSEAPNHPPAEAPVQDAFALPEAALWVRLSPFADPEGRVTYAVGVAGVHGDPPDTPVMTGVSLPAIDLDLRVRPTLSGGQLHYAGSLLPRGLRPAAPNRARAHAPSDHPAVRRAAIDARRTGGPADVRRLLDTIVDPGPANGPLDPLPPLGRGPHVTVIGLGLVVPDHVTHEAEASIRAAREVLFVNNGLADESWLSARCPRVTALRPRVYVEGRTRLETYAEMAVATLVAALDHAPVVFAMSGHPLIGAYAPFLIADGARALGLEVCVQPGVSALDAILAELEIDPVLTGLQLVEATDLLLQQRPLQSDVPALIWQVGTVGSLIHDDRVRDPERYASLRDHLLRFWPPDHPVTAIHVSPHPFIRGRRDTVPLADLCALASHLHAGVSLWVPADHARPLADPGLANGLLH